MLSWSRAKQTFGLFGMAPSGSGSAPVAACSAEPEEPGKRSSSCFIPYLGKCSKEEPELFFCCNSGAQYQTQGAGALPGKPSQTGPLCTSSTPPLEALITNLYGKGNKYRNLFATFLSRLCRKNHLSFFLASKRNHLSRSLAELEKAKRGCRGARI